VGGLAGAPGRGRQARCVRCGAAARTWWIPEGGCGSRPGVGGLPVTGILRCWPAGRGHPGAQRRVRHQGRPGSGGLLAEGWTPPQLRKVYVRGLSYLPAASWPLHWPQTISGREASGRWPSSVRRRVSIAGRRGCKAVRVRVLEMYAWRRWPRNRATQDQGRRWRSSPSGSTPPIPAPSTGPTCSGRYTRSLPLLRDVLHGTPGACPVVPTGGSQRAMSGWGGYQLRIGPGFCEAQACPQ
jgi:hypothetical protein